MQKFKQWFEYKKIKVSILNNTFHIKKINDKWPSSQNMFDWKGLKRFNISKLLDKDKSISNNMSILNC